MKLRQKLAVVLAATMIATSVPVVTMAQSDNSLTIGQIVGEKDQEVSAITSDAKLKIELKDNVGTSDAIVYVNLKNAEWTITNPAIKDGTGAAIGTAVKNNASEVQVTIPANTAKGTYIYVDLSSIKLTGGAATIAVDSNGTVVSDMAAVVFASTTDSKAVVTAGDATSLYDEGKIADISVLEGIKGQLVDTDAADVANRTIKLTLKHPDYKFLATEASMFVSSRGFGATLVPVTFAVDPNDDQVINVVLPPAAAALASTGRIEFKGLKVQATTKAPAAGDLNVTVSGDKVTETTLKVANVASYGTKVSVKDSKAVAIAAGKKEKVTFTVEESAQDSFTAGKTVTVKLDKAFLAANATDAAAPGAISVAKVKVNDDTVALALTPEKDSNNYITGFSFTMPARGTAAGELDATKTNKITFEDLMVYAPLNESGEVKATVDGRGVGEEASAVVANIAAPVSVTTEAIQLKVGLKDQKGGKITIKEADKGKIANDKLVLSIPASYGIDFSVKTEHKPVIKVTAGDLIIDSYKVLNSSQIEIAVKRASTVASTIEISDMVVSSDRTVPEGKYEARLSGVALTKDGTVMTDKNGADADKNDIVISDFVVVATPNVDDQASNGMKKGTTSFVVGSSKFVANGSEKEMDAAAYVSAAGRTMIPVRYLADAFGIDSKNIMFSGGVITIIAGNRTVQIKNGSNIAVVNGVQMTMDEKVVIKNGRTYAPASQIGNILGVTPNWDAATKTASFTN